MAGFAFVDVVVPFPGNSSGSQFWAGAVLRMKPVQSVLGQWPPGVVVADLHFSEDKAEEVVNCGYFLSFVYVTELRRTFGDGVASSQDSAVEESW